MMDKEYFINAFDTSAPISWNGLNNSPVEQQSFLQPNSSRFSHFDFPLASNEGFALGQMIGEHGGNIAPDYGFSSHDQMNRGIVGNSLPLPAIAADPGFAERAAKFSCFGSRSFNGRSSTPIGLNNAELHHKIGNFKMTRVSSSPVLKQTRSPPLHNVNLSQSFMEMRPNDEMLLCSDKSSVSEQMPSGEKALKTLDEPNSRKRKSVSKGKFKEDDGSDSAKDEDRNVKRSKSAESNEKQNVGSKTEEPKGGSNEKPPEAPKDYIHVRARRGQATDSHSLAERVRREKISERMKLLQDLVPGCNKVTGKALMLDEIINYVQSLQCQVEFLSMKLASVNPELDVMDNVLTKDVFQQNGTAQQQFYPLDSSAPNNNQNLHHNNASNGTLSGYTTGPTQTRNSIGVHLPSLDGYSELLPQFLALGEDDLHSIVSMGIGQNLVSCLTAPNQTSDMKVEQ